MKHFNTTITAEFVLLSFSDFYQYQIVLFIFVLLTYITSIAGNTAIIGLVRFNPSLHTPMYLYICTFSALEIMFVSSTIPKLLVSLVSTNNNISFVSCFTQLYVFNSLGVTECYLLSVMVFDRHLAIHNPLQYPAIMTTPLCTKLAILPWMVGFVIVLAPTVITAQFEFCSSKINHFFCDFAPLQSMACSIPHVVIVITSSIAFLDVVVPFIIILGFYVQIIFTVVKINSTEGKKKTFSTCSSHLIVASLFYGTATIVYVKPNVSQYDKFLALMYTAVTPFINPFIYSFRNRDVKEAFKKCTEQFLKKQWP